LSKEMLGVEQNQPVQENGTVDQKWVCRRMFLLSNKSLSDKSLAVE
jgi:hypothetical protein